MRNLFWLGLYFTAGVTLALAIGKALSGGAQHHDVDHGSIPINEERLRMIYNAADRDFV